MVQRAVVVVVVAAAAAVAVLLLLLLLRRRHLTNNLNGRSGRSDSSSSSNSRGMCQKGLNQQGRAGAPPGPHSVHQRRQPPLQGLERRGSSNSSEKETR